LNDNTGSRICIDTSSGSISKPNIDVGFHADTRVGINILAQLHADSNAQSDPDPSPDTKFAVDLGFFYGADPGGPCAGHP
jgi:hypothetical protein